MIGVVPVLIKKKDVNEYFATRRAGHPLRARRAGAVPATDPSKEKRDGKALSAAPIDVARSSASTQDLGVPLFTSEHGFIGPPPSVTKRKEKS
jgi:hypothetical protein